MPKTKRRRQLENLKAMLYAIFRFGLKLKLRIRTRPPTLGVQVMFGMVYGDGVGLSYWTGQRLSSRSEAMDLRAQLKDHCDNSENSDESSSSETRLGIPKLEIVPRSQGSQELQPSQVEPFSEEERNLVKKYEPIPYRERAEEIASYPCPSDATSEDKFYFEEKKTEWIEIETKGMYTRDENNQLSCFGSDLSGYSECKIISNANESSIMDFLQLGQATRRGQGNMASNYNNSQLPFTYGLSNMIEDGEPLGYLRQEVGFVMPPTVPPEQFTRSEMGQRANTFPGEIHGHPVQLERIGASPYTSDPNRPPFRERGVPVRGGFVPNQMEPQWRSPRLFNSSNNTGRHPHWIKNPGPAQHENLYERRGKAPRKTNEQDNFPHFLFPKESKDPPRRKPSVAESIFKRIQEAIEHGNKDFVPGPTHPCQLRDSSGDPQGSGRQAQNNLSQTQPVGPFASEPTRLPRPSFEYRAASLVSPQESPGEETIRISSPASEASAHSEVVENAVASVEDNKMCENVTLRTESVSSPSVGSPKELVEESAAAVNANEPEVVSVSNDDDAVEVTTEPESAQDFATPSAEKFELWQPCPLALDTFADDAQEEFTAGTAAPLESPLPQPSETADDASAEIDATPAPVHDDHEDVKPSGIEAEMSMENLDQYEPVLLLSETSANVPLEERAAVPLELPASQPQPSETADDASTEIVRTPPPTQGSEPSGFAVHLVSSDTPMEKANEKYGDSLNDAKPIPSETEADAEKSEQNDQVLIPAEQIDAEVASHPLVAGEVDLVESNAPPERMEPVTEALNGGFEDITEELSMLTKSTDALILSTTSLNVEESQPVAPAQDESPSETERNCPTASDILIQMLVTGGGAAFTGNNTELADDSTQKSTIEPPSINMILPESKSSLTVGTGVETTQQVSETSVKAPVTLEEVPKAQLDQVLEPKVPYETPKTTQIASDTIPVCDVEVALESVPESDSSIDPAMENPGLHTQPIPQVSQSTEYEVVDKSLACLDTSYTDQDSSQAATVEAPAEEQPSPCPEVILPSEGLHPISNPVQANETIDDLSNDTLSPVKVVESAADEPMVSASDLLGSPSDPQDSVLIVPIADNDTETLVIDLTSDDVASAANIFNPASPHEVLPKVDETEVKTVSSTAGETEVNPAQVSTLESHEVKDEKSYDAVLKAVPTDSSMIDDNEPEMDSKVEVLPVPPSEQLVQPDVKSEVDFSDSLDGIGEAPGTTDSSVDSAIKTEESTVDSNDKETIESVLRTLNQLDDDADDSMTSSLKAEGKTEENDSVTSNLPEIDRTVENDSVTSNLPEIDRTVENDSVTSNLPEIDRTVENDSVTSNPPEIDRTEVNDSVISDSEGIDRTEVNDSVTSNPPEIDRTEVNDSVTSDSEGIDRTEVNDSVTSNSPDMDRTEDRDPKTVSPSEKKSPIACTQQ